MPYKDRKKQRKKQAEWFQKNKQRIYKMHKEWREKKIKRAKSIIGDKCLICGVDGRIEFHEIHGNPHEDRAGNNPNYYLKHSEDFVSLCYGCHRAIHHFSKKTGFSLIELLRLIKLLNQK